MPPTLRRLLLFVIVAVAACASVLPAARADSSAASMIFAKINAARSGKLVWHSGLHSVAWDHSRYMASKGVISHYNAAGRISRTPSDPADGGFVDGGMNGDWCENVAVTSWGDASEAAETLYQAWVRSTPHHRCMQDGGMNVAAVGVYHENSYWWATFIAMVDRSPPGGGGAPVAPPPAPKVTAAPKASAPPVERPAPVASRAPAPAAVQPVAPKAPVAFASSPPTSGSVPATARPPGFGSDPTPLIVPTMAPAPPVVLAEEHTATSAMAPFGAQAAALAGVVLMGTLLAWRRLRRIPRLLGADHGAFVWEPDPGVTVR